MTENQVITAFLLAYLVAIAVSYRSVRIFCDTNGTKHKTGTLIFLGLLGPFVGAALIQIINTQIVNKKMDAIDAILTFLKP